MEGGWVRPRAGIVVGREGHGGKAMGAGEWRHRRGGWRQGVRGSVKRRRGCGN